MARVNCAADDTPADQLRELQHSAERIRAADRGKPRTPATVADEHKFSDQPGSAEIASWLNCTSIVQAAACGVGGKA
jgi:hypothetical protein